jgi:hypothetical protein
MKTPQPKLFKTKPRIPPQTVKKEVETFDEVLLMLAII